MKNIKNITSSFENEELFLNTIKYLSDVIDAKDGYTIGHSERVQRYSMRVGNKLQLSKNDLDILYLSSILHDIGKVKIPINILKSSKRLNRYEYREIQRHSVYGAYLLGSFKYVKGLQEAIKYHHERFDGKGYPEGIEGENIPIYSRIIAVCDAFDAMTSRRAYLKNLKTEHHAINELRKNAGTQFDPEIVDAFIDQYNMGYIHLEKALYYMKQFHIDSINLALFLFQNARKMVRHDRSRAYIDYNVGKLIARNGEYKKSIKLMLPFLEFDYDNEMRAGVYNDLASSYYFLGDYNNATLYSKKALAIKEPLLQKARSYRHLAQIAYQTGEHPDTCFDYLNKSEKVYERLYEMIEKQKAKLVSSNFSIVKYNRLINFTKEIRNDTAKYYDIKAFFQYNMGNFEAAHKAYIQSINIKHFYEDIYGSIRSQAGIALVYIDQGLYKDAEYNLFEARNYAEQLHDRQGLRMVYNNLGRLYVYWNKKNKAIEYYRKAFNEACRIGRRSPATESAMFLMRLLKTKAAQNHIRRRYLALDSGRQCKSLSEQMIYHNNKLTPSKLRNMYWVHLEELQTCKRHLEFAKTYYLYLKFIKEHFPEEYSDSVSMIPEIISNITESMVRRRLKKIYDFNTKVSRGSGP